MKWTFFLAVFLLIISCKEKRGADRETGAYTPILSFLQGQQKALDTALFSFTKIESDGKYSDTQIINPSQVRGYASDFLSIPNLRDPKIGRDYTESSLFDSTLNLAVLTYTSDNPKQEVNKLQMNVRQGDTEGEDQIQSVYIEKTSSKGDSTIEKKLIWYVNDYFQVRTIIHKENQPERMRDVQIHWSDFTRD